MNGRVMDPLRQALLQKAAQDALDQVMKGNPGRRAYVLIVADDAGAAAKSHAYTTMPNYIALQYADALEHEADVVRASGQAGLAATARKIALSRKTEEGG